MAAMTYVCKSCGLAVHYSAKQDQDAQPLVNFHQSHDGLIIEVIPTVWVYDSQGRPVQQADLEGVTTVTHICSETLNPPGVNFNLPATNNPDISY